MSTKQQETEKWAEKVVDNSTPEIKNSLCSVVESQTCQYCNQTTLHGFQYLTTTGIIGKIFWLCIIAVCFCFATYYGVYLNITEYLNVNYLMFMLKIQKQLM